MKSRFNPFDFQTVLIDEGNDPDINFFNYKSETVDTPYFSADEFNSSSDKLLKNSFSVLHINIRSLNKNFEKLREYLSLVKRDFIVVALTETWCNDEKATQNSLLQLPNYTPIHQIRNNGQRGGGVVLYVHNSLNFKILKKQSTNSNDLECACIEIVRKNAKNIIVSCIYRPPRRDSHKFLEDIKTLICKNQEKPLFLLGDLNINSLDYSINTNVRDFFNLIFQNGIFPLINRPTRVTKSSATIIDHVLINTVINSEVQSGMIKTDMSDHFAVFALMRTSLVQPNLKKTFIKRDLNEYSIKYFKSILNSVDWDLITQTTPDSSYIFR